MGMDRRVLAQLVVFSHPIEVDRLGIKPPRSWRYWAFCELLDPEFLMILHWRQFFFVFFLVWNKSALPKIEPVFLRTFLKNYVPPTKTTTIKQNIGSESLHDSRCYIFLWWIIHNLDFIISPTLKSWAAGNSLIKGLPLRVDLTKNTWYRYSNHLKIEMAYTNINMYT